MVEDYVYNDEDYSHSSSVPSSCSNSSANSPSWDDGKNVAEDDSNEMSLFEDGAPLEVVDGSIHHRTIRLGGKMLSVMHSDSCDFLIGVQVASLLKRETFNMYRSMKIKSIPIQRATPAQVDFLCKCRAVRSGTHSVTLIPYDTGLVFVSDAFNKMTNSKSKSKRKAKAKAKTSSSPLHTVLRNRAPESVESARPRKESPEWEKVDTMKEESQKRIRATIFDLIRIVTEPEILSDLHDSNWPKKSTTMDETCEREVKRGSQQGFTYGNFDSVYTHTQSVHMLSNPFQGQPETHGCKLPSFTPEISHFQARLPNPINIVNAPYQYLPAHLGVAVSSPMHQLPMGNTAYMNKRRCAVPYEQDVSDEVVSKEKSQESSSTQSLMMLKTILC